MLRRRLMDWWSGALILSGAWMFDELLNESMNCIKPCFYPIPLIGSFALFAAEGFSWIMIIVGALLLIKDEKVQNKEKIHN